MELKAHIGYLINFDSINIYRIWISNREKVIWIWDITFNKELFYNSSELDLGHALYKEVEQIIEVIDAPQPTAQASVTDLKEDFNDLLTLISTQQVQSDIIDNDDDNEDVNTPVITHTPNIDPNNSEQLLTPDSTSEPSNIVDNDLTSALSANQGPIVDFDVRNILSDGFKCTKISSRWAVYVITLRQMSQLQGYYSAFIIGLISGNFYQIKHHQFNLPPEPRSWKQILKYPFHKEFQLAAEKEIKSLRRWGTFKYTQKGSTKKILLPLFWVFKYKLNSDEYLIKFKARLCVRGDL